MEYNIFAAKQRTTREEHDTLDTIKYFLEQECGFQFVRTGPKTRKFAQMRQMLAYTAFRKQVRITHIAAYLGYSSHQSVIHAINLMEGLISYDNCLKTLAAKTLDETDFRKTFGILAQMQ